MTRGDGGVVHRHCAESYRYREMAAGCEVEF